MKALESLILLNKKIYIADIRSLKSQKEKNKLSKAEAQLNTTKPHKDKWSMADSFQFLFSDDWGVKQIKLYFETICFINLCRIKKLPYMQINVLIGFKRGLKPLAIAEELNIVEDTVDYHLKNIRKTTGLTKVEDIIDFIEKEETE